MARSLPKLGDQLRDQIRVKHQSIRTEEAYLDWVHRFTLQHRKHRPKDMGPGEGKGFSDSRGASRAACRLDLDFARLEVLSLCRVWLLRETARPGKLSGLPAPAP